MIIHCPKCKQAYPNVPREADGMTTACIKCGEKFRIRLPAEKTSYSEEAVRDWKVGETILKLYEVKAILGQGGFGKVYRLHHRNWGIDLAVKTPNRKAIEAAGGVENFEREAETWVNLGLHPNTVSCYYVRRIDGIPRVFAEYITGGDLEEWIDNGRLYKGSTKEVLASMLDIAIQFAWGLHYAHEQQLIHQDVKPANLMMTDDGTAKVTDFGLARARAMPDFDSGGQTIMVRGSGYTPAYASPEQLGSKKLTRRTDIWSWAASVFQMFVGERTWRSGAVVGYQLDEYLQNGPPRSNIPRIPDALVQLLQECFEEDADHRPHDLQLVANRLIQIYRQATGKTYPRTAPKAGRDTADSLNNRAISMLDLGRNKEAVATWDRALAIQPHHPECTYNRGLTRWQLNMADDEAAVNAMTLAAQMTQPAWYCLQLLAQIHLQRGDCDGALRALARINEEETDDPGYKKLIQQASHELDHSRKRLNSLHSEWGLHAIALDANGRTALSGSMGGMLELWDVQMGRLVTSIRGHTTPVRAVAISADGSLGVSGSRSGEVKVWNLDNGNCLATFKQHVSAISCLTLSADGNHIVSGSEDQAIHMWHGKTLNYMHAFHGHRGTIGSVSVDTRQRRLLTSSHDKTLKWWDLDSGECLQTLQGHTDAVGGAGLSPDGKRAISGSHDKTVRIWNTQNGQCLHTLPGHTTAITTLQAAQDLPVALSGSENGTLKLWDIRAGRCLFSFIHAHKEAVTGISLSHDGTRAVSASLDQYIHAWALDMGYEHHAPIMLSQIRSTEVQLSTQEDYARELAAARTASESGDHIQTAACVRKVRSLPGYSHDSEATALWRNLYPHLQQKSLVGIWEYRRLDGHEGPARAVALNQDATLALSGGDDSTVRLWDTSTGKCQRVFNGHSDAVTSVAFSAGGRFAFSASRDRTLKQWDTHTGACLHTFTGHRGAVNALYPDPGNQFLLSASDDKTLKLWQVASGRCLRTYRGHTEPVTACWIAPDGQRLLSGSDDKTIRVWHMAHSKSLHTLGTFNGHREAITAICGTQSGEYALTGSADSTLKLWNVDTDHCSRTLSGHDYVITSATLSLDMRYILSSSVNGVIKLWQAQTGKCLHTLSVENNSVNSTCLANHRGLILAACEDGSIRSWMLDWELQPYKGKKLDEHATPYLEAFIKRHRQPATHLPESANLTEKEITEGLTRQGGAKWSEGELHPLRYTLGCIGFGWVTPSQIQSRLQPLAREMERRKEADIEALENSSPGATVTDYARTKTSTHTTPQQRAGKSAPGKQTKPSPLIKAIKLLVWLIILGYGGFEGYRYVIHMLEERSLEQAQELATEKQNINQKDEYGMTLLHIVAERGHAKAVEYLIQQGATVNIRDNRKRIPLHYAAESGHAEVVTILLRHGAYAHLAAGPNKITPLMLAQENGHQEVVEILQRALDRQ